MELNDYQVQAEATDESRRTPISIYGLISEVASVIGTFKKRLVNRGEYPGFRDELLEELGDALWYLTSVATRHEITLEQVASTNLQKARLFADPGRVHHFDKECSQDEKFPRQFKVSFSEKELGRTVQVKLMINEVIVGDALTDNAYDEDGYRYHDAFHLAYVAVLGWSPVMRGLLRRKRKGDPEKDEVEDGARAAIVEEAISIFVFQQARRYNFFSDIDRIPFNLLKTIQELAGHLEVKACTPKQWERAILLGYEMFRQLKANKGGILELDLDKQGIKYTPPNCEGG